MKLFQHGMAALPVWDEISSTGMPVYLPYFENLYDELTVIMMGLAKDLSAFYFDEEPINPGSPKDTNKLLEKRDLASEKLTPGGDWSTAKDAIEPLRYIDGAFEILFDWREVQHTRDAFVNPVLEAGHFNEPIEDYPDYYNIMGDLQITRVASRRPSMKKKPGGVNLLNLPSRQRMGMREGLAKKIRSGYIAPDNERLVAADQSQVELRYLAHASQDPIMCKSFIEGEDIHSRTSIELFGTDDEAQRKIGKLINFLITYGGGENKLLQELKQAGIEGEDKDSCREMIQGYYLIYKGVAQWKADEIGRIKAKGGFASTHLGMRRYLIDLFSKDFAKRSAAEREAISLIIQGGAQDLIQSSMAWVHEMVLAIRSDIPNARCHCGLQLYDELIYRVQPDLAETVLDILIEGLSKHVGIQLRVPILADGVIGQNWGEL